MTALPHKVSPTSNPQMAAYLSSLVSASTVRDYANSLSVFLGYLVDIGFDAAVDLGKATVVTYGEKVVRETDIDKNSLLSFLLYLKDLNLRLHKLSNTLSTVRAYLRFLYLNGQTEQDLSVVLRVRLRDQYRPGDRYRPEEIRQLLAAARTGPPKHYLVLLLLAHSLRPQEIGRICWEDVNVSGQTLRIKGKTRNEDFPLSVESMVALETLRVDGDGKGALFPRYLLPTGELRERPWGSYVSRILRKVCERSGVRLGKPYWLRRAAAQTLADIKTPLADIKGFLRHSSEQTTVRYLSLSSVQLERLRSIQEKRVSTQALAKASTVVWKALNTPR